jgi:DNA-binding transcriptional regulator PaaX
VSKYRYYFQKPKSEIVKDIFYWLTVAGAVSIAATSPYFVSNIIKGFKKSKKYKSKKVYDTFYKLRKRGYIEIENKNHQIYIKLTEKGRKKAGWFQINNLKIKKPKKWDKKWRIVIFDISHIKRFYREIFRGKLKELGFYSLQKSVWINPFDCRDEIELLKDFLGLKEKEVRLIVAKDIGDANWLKIKFKLR